MNSSKINELKNLKEQNQTEEKKKNVSFNVNIKNNESIEMDDKLRPKKQNPNRIEIDAGEKLDDEKKTKIFMTENFLNLESKELFTFHDVIVPGGKNAKLCLIKDPNDKKLRVTEIADHLKFYEPTPVIVLIGANTKNKGKLMAGLSRAAFNTRALVIDSGIQTGVEKFCIRKNINLIGIAPESMIEFPKPNPDKFSSKMLTNGHTHFLLVGNDKNKLMWGDESKFKLNFADRIASGRKGFNYKCKCVGVILGNVPNCEDEILTFIDKGWPLILIDDSDMSITIKELREGKIEDKSKVNQKWITIANYSKLIDIEEDSENLASAIHISLTISF